MWQTRWGKCIYVSPSGYEVYQNAFYRWLTLGTSPLQTVIRLNQPQKPVLHYLPMLSVMARSTPGETCLLGLGGGGILHLLRNTISQPLWAVEMSAEVIEIAQRFFFIDLISDLQIVNRDALDFLKETPHRFKHLLVDLYDGQHFPEACQKEAFFNLCKQRIADDGFLAVNLANGNDQSFILQLIKKQFPNTLSIPIHRCQNLVIIASANPDKPAFLAQMQQTQAFSKLFWIDSWGYVGHERLSFFRKMV